MTRIPDSIQLATYISPGAASRILVISSAVKSTRTENESHLKENNYGVFFQSRFALMSVLVI